MIFVESSKVYNAKSFVAIVLLIFAESIRTTYSNEINRFENRPGTEQRLIERLFRNYNRKSRPPGTVQIKFALNLNQIVNLNQKDQIMVLNAFIDHEWIDPRLAWDPLQYDNITIIRVTGDHLWTPDTFIYTTADQTGFLLPQNGAQFVIRNEGVVFWPNPLTQMQVRCSMGIMWFPFDEQLCVIVFGSWSFTCGYLNYSLMVEDPSLENYTEHNEWTMMAYRPYRHEIKYPNWIENDSFSEIRYKILIRRKPLFVIQNCVIPAIMLCILTLVSFFIPFAQAMQIGISIMLAFSVFKLRLSDDVPVQADTVPLINIYFTLCMSFSLNAMIWFSYINLLRERKVVPRFIRYIVVNYICFIMRIKTKSKSQSNSPTQSVSKSSSQATPTQQQQQPQIKENTFSIMIKNQDGANKNVLTAQSQLYPSNPHIVIDQSTNSMGSNSRISTYYKTINDASYMGQFNYSPNPNNRFRKSAHNHSVNSRRSEKLKKKRPPQMSRERTQSDSEFERELENLKHRRKKFTRAEEGEYITYEMSDTCEEDTLVWVPQKKPANRREKKQLRAHLKYLEQNRDDYDPDEYYPIRIDYDSSHIDMKNDETTTIRHVYGSSHCISSQQQQQQMPTYLKKSAINSNNNNNHSKLYSSRIKSNESLVNYKRGGDLAVNKRKSCSSSMLNEDKSLQLRRQTGNESTIDIKVVSNDNTVVDKSPPKEQSQSPSQTSCDLSEMRIIKILNEFVFYLFLLFCISLNLFGLVIFPYFIKQPMAVDDVCC